MAKAGSVADYLEALPAPTRAIVERLRVLAIDAAPGVRERIKWNAPSFGTGDDDRITFGFDRRGGVRVVLHRGVARKNTAGFAFDDPTGRVQWAAVDRGVLTFSDADDLASAEPGVAALFRDWIAATT